MERCSVLASELGELPTPYIAEGFKTLLHQTGLTSRYPNIVLDITQGSPIGNPTAPTETFIPKNMKTAHDMPHIIDEHIQEEISAGRMSGPFTVEEAHTIFGGHFRTTPLGLVQKEPGSAKWRLVRNASKKDSCGVSVNSMLNSDDFPTRWGSAWMVAQYVSILSFLLDCVWRTYFFNVRPTA